jgi:GDP-4-dehydro-6-deoxy-D-mannose reductase
VTRPETVLITGAAGFVSGHLVVHLRERWPGVHILGLDRPRGAAPPPVGLRLLEIDLTDPESDASVFDVAHPDAIVHLAGQSSVHHSWLDPGGTLRTNILGLVHLLDAARRRSLRPTVLVIGSADEYGVVSPDELPLAESAPLRGVSPYAVSKVAQGLLALEFRSAGMRILRTRTFPHTGPGRGEAFAESSFARQIAEIEVGLRAPVIEVGNLEAVRDYSDARDVVRAYADLIEKGRDGEVYNVCSGRGTAIRGLLDILLNDARVDVEVRVDKTRLRPSDIPALIGDARRLHDHTGWEPQIPIERTLGDLLEAWRSAVRTQ